MTLGGRRVACLVARGFGWLTVERGSCRLRATSYFADRDPLTRAVMDRMLAGVSTRKFARVGEPVGQRGRARPRRRREGDGVGGVHRAHAQRAG